MDNTTTDCNEEKPSATVLSQIMDNQGEHSNLPPFSQSFANQCNKCKLLKYKEICLLM